MARQIIKQPDGQYCIFSSVVDHFIVVDATKAEILEFLREEQVKKITAHTNKILESLENDKSTTPYKEALKTIKEVHGTFDLF